MTRFRQMTLVLLLLVTATSTASATVYINRDYYWYEPTHEYRYNVVDRVYDSGSSPQWLADSNFGLQGSGPEYVLEASVYVRSGATLTMGPGITVKVPGGRGIYSAGVLNAQGTAGSRITITSTSASPAAGAWEEIAFIGAGANSSVLRFVDIRYAGAGTYHSGGGWYHNSYGSVLVNDCSPVIDQCTISNSGNYGIYGQNACQATITACTISNSPYGMVFTDASYHAPFGSTLPIRANTITGCGVATHCSAQAAGALDATNTVSGNTRNVCEIYGGQIQNAAAWRLLAGSPVWYLRSDVYCGEGKSLTVAEGAVVKFMPAFSLYCNGTLTANGSAAKKIYFTSSQDDTVGGDSNGDGAATSPAAGDWSEIILINPASSASSFANCEFRYAGNGRYVPYAGFYHYETAPLTFSNSSAPVSNCRFFRSANDGIHLMTGSRPPVSSSSFQECGRYAIRCNDIDSNPVITSCSAMGCGGNSIRIPSGTMTGSRTWYKSVPYHIDTQVWLAADASLTVNPGTAVKVGGGGGIYVRGNLQAIGTSAEPIYFTSLADDIYGDTNNNGAATAPAPSDWEGVDIYDATATPSRFEWCTFRYAGNGAYTPYDGLYAYHYGNVYTRHCSPTFANCVFERSGNYGLYSKWASNPVLQSCTLRNNNYGIVIEDDAFQASTASTRVNGCTITANNWAASMSAEALNWFAANNTLSGNVSNGVQIWPSSIVSDTATWRRMQGTPTIVLGGTVRVPAGKTLTILQDNVIKMKTAVSMYAFGTLLAQGAPGHRVTFTSYLDDSVDGDTNADGAGSSAARGDWNTILFSGADSSSSLMQHTQVKYGARGDYISDPGYYLTHNGAVIFRQTDADLQDVEIKESNVHGIVILDGCHPALTRANVTGSGSYAIWQHITSNATVTACSASGNGGNAIYQQDGTIGDSRTWYKSIPYVIGANLWLAEGNTLTLQPGAVVKFHPGVGMYIRGALQAVAGDAEEKIVFTSYLDDAFGGDSNADGTGTVPAPGSWMEMVICGAGSNASHMKNCIVRYGGNNVYNSNPGFYHYAYGTLMLSTTSALIEKCDISRSGNVGIYCHENCLADIVQNVIHTNTGHGLYMENSYNTIKDPLPVRGNDIRGNLAYAAINVNSNASLSIASDNQVHGNAENRIDVREGEITISGTWHKVSSGNCPFSIVGHTWFNSPQELTIEPGVTVKFRGGAWFGAAGLLHANGEPGDRITFTSEKDDTVAGDTNGDGTATSPVGGDYAEVLLYGGGTASTLSYCSFRYGGNSVYHSWGGFYHYAEGNLLSSGGAPVFDHCDFGLSARDGMVCSAADATFQSCTFANNPRIGLYTYGDSDISLNSCISSGNPTATQVNGEEGGSIVANYCDLVGVNSLRKTLWDSVNNRWYWAWTDTFPPGTGSFSADPLFAYAAGGNFNLSPPSPCINTGDPAKTDPDGSRMDVGAYPFTGAVATPTVGSTRNLPDGANIQLTGKTVTAGTNEVAGRLYIEDPDRSSGIAVITTTPVSAGAVVSVSGSLGLVGGERALINTIVQVVSPSGAQLPVPMYVNGRDMGGRSLNAFNPGVPGSAGMYNLGLLIRASGKVTAVGTGCFWLDDGGSRAAEGGTTGIKVLSNAAVTVGKVVKVTGVSSAYSDGGTVRSVIRTRTAADVTAVN